MLAAQVLLGLNALVWFIFGAYTLTEMMQRNPGQVALLRVLGILMFVNACAWSVSSLVIGIRRKSSYYFVVGILILNIILTITDQFGIFDFVTLLIDLAILGILIVGRNKHFLAINNDTILK
jgi:hypothetical protein